MKNPARENAKPAGRQRNANAAATAPAPTQTACGVPMKRVAQPSNQAVPKAKPAVQQIAR